MIPVTALARLIALDRGDNRLSNTNAMKIDEADSDCRPIEPGSSLAVHVWRCMLYMWCVWQGLHALQDIYRSSYRSYGGIRDQAEGRSRGASVNS